MKFYRFTDENNTWSVEYRTSGMENSISEKITNIKTIDEDGNYDLDLNSEMVAAGLPVHLGDEITQVGLVELAENNSLRLTKQYESEEEELLVAAAPKITSFVLGEQESEANIDDDAKTIEILVASGTDVSSLAPEITLSYGSTVTPVSGSTVDFTNAVDFTVTDETGNNSVVYTVTVSVNED